MPDAAAAGEQYLADWAGPDDLHALAQLQTHLWSPDPDLNRARLAWKYGLDGGASDAARVAVVRHRGQPIGMRGFLRQTWEVDGTPHELFASDDLVIVPAHRGKGLFGRLNALAYPALARAGAPFVLSASPLAATRRLLAAEGAVTVGPFHPIGRRATSVRLRDATAATVGRLPYLWRWADRIPQGAGAAQAFSRLPPAHGSAITITDTPWPDAMAALLASLPPDRRMRLRRDRAFFAARFADPLHEYRFLYAGSRQGITGYLVLERSRSPFASARRVHVADWEATDAATARRLLDPLIEPALFAELVTWAEALPPACADAAAGAGLRPVDTHLVRRGQPSFMLLPLRGGTGRPMRLGDRDLTDRAQWAPRLLYTSYV